MSAFSQRLKELRTEKNLTQAEFGTLFNLSKQTISGYEKGDASPSFDTLLKLADYFGVTTDDLLGREPKTPPKMHKVPLLGPIKAGVPILSTDNYTETIEPPDGVIADFAAPVEGDSMIYAGIYPDDIAFFRECREPKPGHIVAARVLDYDAAVNLKFYVQKNGQAVLRSANPEYKDIPFTKNHAVVGIMTGLIRDGAPVLRDYETVIYSKERLDERWNKVVYQAINDGVSPEQFAALIATMKKFLKGE